MFRTVALVVLAASLGQLGWTGWRTVTNAPRDELSPPGQPTGRGWYELVETEPAPPYRGRAMPVAVWWNPTEACVAAAGTFTGVILVVCIALASQRTGVRRRLRPTCRSQGRLEAALHYNTAWLVLLVPAAMMGLFRPVVDLSAAGRWPVALPAVAVYAPTAVLAVLAVFGYGFGLMRLAATVPKAVRTRMVLFLGVWHPLLVAICGGAAGAGLYFWHGLLTAELNLGW